jgi:3-phytase
MVYVTDNYAMPDESVPPDSLLGERVRQYRVTVTGGGLRAEPVRAFGDISGPGVLKVVESIALDLPNYRVLIAEELETGSHIKVYTPEGKLTGQIIGGGFGNFPSGAFYAVHNDGNVAAFSWAAIAEALGLRKDCASPAGAAEHAS